MKKIATRLLLVSMLSTTASAEFVFKTPDPSLEKQINQFLAQSVSGFGEDTPLSLALPLIMEDTTIETTGLVDMNRMVSWEPSQSIRSVLDVFFTNTNIAWRYDGKVLYLVERTLPARAAMETDKGIQKLKSFHIKGGADARDLILNWCLEARVIVDWPADIPSIRVGPDYRFDDTLPNAIEMVMDRVTKTQRTVSWSFDPSQAKLVVRNKI